MEETVRERSHGKLKLSIKKLSYNYFTHRMLIKQAVFISTDTATASNAYRFGVKEIRLEMRGLLPFILHKKLYLDSLYLQSPEIEVTTLRFAKDSTKDNSKNISIPYEMGKVYKSIQDALQVLQVTRFQIDDGKFTLYNKIQPDQIPLRIKNFHFHIDNLKVDTGKITGREKILFSDNVVFSSTNQDILFPDGRHRLSFSNFKINLQKKLVEFDSCTIAATRSDSTASSFNVFFDVLQLTNIDFDTLYKSEVIKADSVYSINPKFNLEVEVGKRKGNKPPPKLENIIQQLTGDLQLRFVGVTNADFNIKTIKDGVPSSFTFTKNNFEMQGLSIVQNSKKPITVKGFAMAIRNYENFIKDSSYSIKFDSVLFKDDRITLSNFLFNKLNDNGKVLNTFSIPQFNLVGLSWDDLVFNKQLKAEQAIMFNPHIRYSVANNTSKKQQTIFQSLGAVNDFMDLQQLDIKNGDIDVTLKNDLRVQLDNATLSIQSHNLLESKKITGIKNSLTQLKFDNGIIHIGNLEMTMHDIFYIGKTGKFDAGTISVVNANKTTNINLEQVNVNNMQVDEANGNLYADGIKWQKATIRINSEKDKTGKNIPFVVLKNVHGNNTALNAIFNGTAISTNLSKLSFTELRKKGHEKLILDGLDVTGTQLAVKNNRIDLAVANYDIADNKSSSFHGLLYKMNNGRTSASFTIPSLTVTPHIQPLLNGDIAFEAINIAKPIIDIRILEKKDSGSIRTPLPKIDISELNLHQPEILFSQATDSGLLTLYWHGEKDNANFLQAYSLHTDAGKTSVGNLKFYLTNFIFTNTKGKKFSTGDGKVTAQLKNINVVQLENQSLSWNGNLSSFEAKDFRLDSIGKAKGNLVLHSGIVGNLNISSANITHLQQLVSANAAFVVKGLTGHYEDADTRLRWYNANFNRNNNVFNIDSFYYNPALEKDSFFATQSYQTDYMTVKTGAIHVGPVDLDRYISKKTLNIGSVVINDFSFLDYRDKKLPFNAGIIKPLPVNMIKNINQAISIDTVLLNNAFIKYTEPGEKTKQPGTVPITRMTITITNLKNHDLSPTDSLRILATGYLMDTAWIRLLVKQSYIDSLGGFIMTVRMKPTDLRVLNPVLIPLASVKIESGSLDTLSMKAIGREYLALGEMDMYYHDLKIRILKNGDEKRKNVFTGLLNFVANSFVVKNKNSSRTGNVFFIRIRDRSAINYLVKIAMSGIGSSIGAKSNKKMIKKYKKELKQHGLPAIDPD